MHKALLLGMHCYATRSSCARNQVKSLPLSMYAIAADHEPEEAIFDLLAF